MNGKLSAKELFWVLLTVTLGILIYARSLTHGFVWDDSFYVFENPFVSSWAGLKNIWFHNNIIEEYYPVTLSCIGLEYKLWGVSAWGYHVISLVFHILNALLLFGLLRKWAPRLAGIIALLFVIHPIHVETVAWISEQKNLFCFFFFLLAVHAFLDFEVSRKKRAYAKSLLFFIAALLSKPIAACFAFVPLLYGWWKRGSLCKRDFLLAMPLFLIGGMISILHLDLVNAYSISPQIPDLPLSLIERVLLAGRIFFFYIQQMILPRDFMTFYPKWTIGGNPVTAWLYPAGVLTLYAILFWKRHRLGRGAFALLCFYGVSLFPVLGLLDFCWHRFSYVADHYTYLSVPSILLLFCSGISLLLSKIRTASWAPSPFFKKSIVAAVIVYLSILSFRLTLNYKDGFTLWWQLLRQNPHSSFAYAHLGILCRDSPKICTQDQTIFLFRKAILLKPDYLYPYVDLGKIYGRNGRYQEALDTYRHAITLAKPFTQALCYLEMADIHLLQRQRAEALPYLEKSIALETDPEYQRERKTQPEAPLREASARRSLGVIYTVRGENQKAIRLFRQAIILNPKEVDSYAGLGAAFMNSGDYKNAAQAFQEALELEPENESVKNNLAAAQMLLDRSESGDQEKKELPRPQGALRVM
ncbi:MAG: tetratricopeptide repeat protein [Candidatus Omnitrophota bacterium]